MSKAGTGKGKQVEDTETSKSNVTEFFSKKGDKPLAFDYDKLSQVNQDHCDEIAQMGYRVDRVKAGFIASQIHGDNRVGPCDSIVVLYNEVKVIAAGSKSQEDDKPIDIDNLPSGMSMVDETANGRTLPGMEVPSVKELDTLIRQRAAAVRAFTAASAEVQRLNGECLAAFEAQKQHFVLYPEKKKHIYKSPAGGELWIKHEVTDKVGSSLDEDEGEE